MVRKYHNHKLQTNTWYHEAEPHKNNETLGRETTQGNQLSLPNQDDCKIRIVKKCHIQQNTEQIQTPTMGVTINNKSTTTEPPPFIRTDSSLSYRGGGGGLKHSAVVEVQEMFSSHESLPTFAMYHQGETLYSN